MNDEGLRDLSYLLSLQLELQHELLVLEKEKTDILVKGDINSLDDFIRQEQSLVLKSVGLEKKREKLLTETGFLDYSLREIIEKYDTNDSYQLKTLFQRLISTIGQLQKTNDKNNQIVLSRLSILGQCLSLIGLREETLTYKKDGHF